MNSFIPVIFGGAVGAALRHGVGIFMVARFGAGFPYGTLAVNWFGSFAMGILAALVLRGGTGEGLRLFLGVGVLGGFTTFSAFSLDSVQMIERGQWGMFGGFAIMSVIGSIGLLMLGAWLARSVAGMAA